MQAEETITKTITMELLGVEAEYMEDTSDEKLLAKDTLHFPFSLPLTMHF